MYGLAILLYNRGIWRGFNTILSHKQTAVVTYSNNATVNINFDSDVNDNEADLLGAVAGIPLSGGFTNTPEALEKAIFDVFGSTYAE